MTPQLRRAFEAAKALIERDSTKYSSIPDSEITSESIQAHQNERPTSNIISARKVIALFMVVAAGLAAAFFVYSGFSFAGPCETISNGYQCQTFRSHFWGQYSPYFSIPSEISPDTPMNCEITFAQMLARHGARGPTMYRTIKYAALIQQIQSDVETFNGKYAFLQSYDFVLNADQLTFFGEQQMVNSGTQFYTRYQSLASSNDPFVRSAGQERVVASAVNWTQGFHASRAADSSSTNDSYPYPILSIPEGSQFNNTLSNDICPAFKDSVSKSPSQSAFASTFLPAIITRLNAALAPVTFTPNTAIYLMDMCPFDTVASPTAQISPFCALFTPSEWRSYDYFQTLGKFYLFSQGNPLAPTLGVGFTNELIARLTKSPVDDHTCTNSTLDGSPTTFPLDRKLYADFSHDNDMLTVWAAMGLYNDTKPLPWDRIESAEEAGGFSASWTVPFAARTYFEKMMCQGAEEEFVRVVMNDRVLPLRTCGGDEFGRCTLSAFVKSLGFARSGGNWERCWE